MHNFMERGKGTSTGIKGREGEKNKDRLLLSSPINVQPGVRTCQDAYSNTLPTNFPTCSGQASVKKRSIKKRWWFKIISVQYIDSFDGLALH